MIRIAVFASGNGTNAQNIIEYFQASSIAKVILVLSNNKNAKVFERAKLLNVKAKYFSKKELNKFNNINNSLLKNVDFIVLAGFLLHIPVDIINQFQNKIVNIHPALLPKYGGKGMYGMHVHQAVKDNNETKTGITIHYVNEKYDEGDIIFQKSTMISSKDTPLDIANKVHQLEQTYFPRIINDLLSADTKTTKY